MAINKAEYLRISLALQDLNELKSFLETVERTNKRSFAVHRLNRAIEYLDERKVAVEPMKL